MDQNTISAFLEELEKIARSAPRKDESGRILPPQRARPEGAVPEHMQTSPITEQFSKADPVVHAAPVEGSVVSSTHVPEHPNLAKPTLRRPTITQEVLETATRGLGAPAHVPVAAPASMLEQAATALGHHPVATHAAAGAGGFGAGFAAGRATAPAAKAGMGLLGKGAIGAGLLGAGALGHHLLSRQPAAQGY